MLLEEVALGLGMQDLERDGEGMRGKRFGGTGRGWGHCGVQLEELLRLSYEGRAGLVWAYWAGWGRQGGREAGGLDLAAGSRISFAQHC